MSQEDFFERGKNYRVIPGIDNYNHIQQMFQGPAICMTVGYNRGGRYGDFGDDHGGWWYETCGWPARLCFEVVEEG
jgi:hypothetical protein